MKSVKIIALLAGAALLLWRRFSSPSKGRKSQSSETVAKPKKKDTSADAAAAPDSELPEDSLRSSTPKDKVAPEGLPTFKSDVTTVQVDVSVLDNKGRFIPRIPRGNFRILEDGVPQQISGFTIGNDAPMTVAMVIEFSNLFQQYWTEGWYQTLWPPTVLSRR